MFVVPKIQYIQVQIHQYLSLHRKPYTTALFTATSLTDTRKKQEATNYHTFYSLAAGAHYIIYSSANDHRYSWTEARTRNTAVNVNRIFYK